MKTDDKLNTRLYTSVRVEEESGGLPLPQRKLSFLLMAIVSMV